MDETNKYPGTGTDEKKAKIVSIISLIEKYQYFLFKNSNLEKVDAQRSIPNANNSYVILETLEEIAMEGEHQFKEGGGKNYKHIPCLNDNDDWVKVMSNWIEKWID